MPGDEPIFREEYGSFTVLYPLYLQDCKLNGALNPAEQSFLLKAFRSQRLTPGQIANRLPKYPQPDGRVFEFKASSVTTIARWMNNLPVKTMSDPELRHWVQIGKTEVQAEIQNRPLAQGKARRHEENRQWEAARRQEQARYHEEN